MQKDHKEIQKGREKGTQIYIFVCEKERGK